MLLELIALEVKQRLLLVYLKRLMSMVLEQWIKHNISVFNLIRPSQHFSLISVT